MKRLLSILISLIIVIGASAPFSAYAYEPFWVDNPLYSGSGITAPLKGGNLAFVEDSVEKSYNGKTYYSRGRQLYLYAKKRLDARKEIFNLYVLYKDELDLLSATNNITQMVFLGATDDEYAKTSTDGDYIRWAIGGFRTLNIKKNTKKDGYNFYTIKVQFGYYDTIKEEQKVDNAVYKLISSLKINGKSEVEIIRAVHDYICDINVYDYPAVNDPYSHLYAFSPYGALLKGKCVCQGYAAATYRILKELGFSVRLVSSDPNWGCHAWNIVELDNQYYILDCTWDDEILDEDDVGIEPDFYFLTDYRTSKKNDSIGQHTLYSSLYENNYFQTNYKNYFAEKPYISQTGARLSECSVSLNSTSFTYSGNAIKPAVTVNDGDILLTEGEDYTLTYSANTKPGLARVDIIGMGEYENTNTHRVFRINPKKAQSLKITGVTASSLTLSWSAPEGGADGYTVQRYSGGKWSNVTSTESTSAVINNLNSSTKQQYRVRAYKTVFKHKFYGSAGSYAVKYTKPKKVTITSLVAKSKAFTVNFKKAKGSGYELQYSQNKNMKNAKTVKVKYGKLSKTIKKLKKGKTYYVRIRAYIHYKNEKGKALTSYGAWSNKKSVKVK